MPPKKSGKKDAKREVPAIDPKSSFTPENFGAELKNLADQAKNETWGKWAVQEAVIWAKAAALLAVVAVYANVSELALSPVYGGIPSSIYHSKVVIGGAFVGWAGNLLLRRNLPMKTQYFLPLIAAYIPMIQFYLFKVSGTLAATHGPLVTELLTIFPLLVFSVACVADILERADLDGLPKWAADAAPGFLSYGIYKFFEMFAADNLPSGIGQSFLQTRMGWELVLASTYTIMAPSKLLLYSIPAFLHAAFLNTHVMTPIATKSLNSTLNADGWTLLDRWESITGYVSVLESDRDGYRVMRCDHSLLGGEWHKLPKPIVSEPVYAVFTMLEAVRLVEVPEKVPDSQAKALNIGLGIGTTPSALIAHGIDTTIVEIDPIVYDFAVKYFGLPANHTAAIEDAVSYTERIAQDQAQSFDYIIHDVFTGGAEPIPLFTLEFLQSLNNLLKPNGVVAINYAGDFTLPPLSTVMHTIREVFPSCRIFRESPAPSAEKLEENGRDFDNVVVFCRKTADKITFRPVVQADLLQSRARAHYLMPRNEVPESAFMTGDDIKLVRKNDTAALANYHDKTGLGHWAVMREVIPKNIWENW
ncbi:spermine/spermidine synthase [Truncatella angustata]|uniref:Spermine/spermidine synthase n=1 Tax=Truncatella angustata TaxID=152316 RepID=A0A9P8RNX4_9PEZI|nr:spermine/spermidine synthase [Truncatella angustata]KAH6647478.1 spermine/spermidine synthase [Truncatella angustata]